MDHLDPSGSDGRSGWLRRPSKAPTRPDIELVGRAAMIEGRRLRGPVRHAPPEKASVALKARVDPWNWCARGRFSPRESPARPTAFGRFGRGCSRRTTALFECGTRETTERLGGSLRRFSPGAAHGNG